MSLNFDEYKKIHKECLELSINKNKDYGSQSLVKYKELGMLIRISDKIDRLDNLIFNKQKINVSDEKIEDTLKDVINYSTYIIMYQRNKLKNEKTD
jgi:hypothetical protein